MRVLTSQAETGAVHDATARDDHRPPGGPDHVRGSREGGGVGQRAADMLSGPRDVVVCAAGSMPGDLHKLWRTRDPKGYHVDYGYSTRAGPSTPATGRGAPRLQAEWDAEVSRLYRLGHGPLPAQSEILGAVNDLLTPGGNWSSYPPHKHDTDNLPTESYLSTAPPGHPPEIRS